MIHVHPNLQEVGQASGLQRRLYRTIRETMRAMAGRICATARWEAKKLLARHIWLDAEHADAIRSRVLELRFPRVDVDLEVDRSLIAVLAKLPAVPGDAGFLGGVYQVVKPAVLDAVRTYLKRSDPLDDAPSHRVLRIVETELAGQLAEFSGVWEDLPVADRAAAEPWLAWPSRSAPARQPHPTKIHRHDNHAHETETFRRHRACLRPASLRRACRCAPGSGAAHHSASGGSRDPRRRLQAR